MYAYILCTCVRTCVRTCVHVCLPSCVRSYAYVCAYVSAYPRMRVHARKCVHGVRAPEGAFWEGFRGVNISSKVLECHDLQL